MKSRLGKPENFFSAQWSRDEDICLRVMWSMGQSMSEIGKSLKRSRNSVAGRIKRLKITRSRLADEKRQA